MEKESTFKGYNNGAKILHWLVLLLLIIQFTLAWTMPGLRHGGASELLELHLSFGVLVLFVMFIRLLSRLFTKIPPYSVALPFWQRIAGGVTHWALYVLLIILPVSGLAYASVADLPVSLFGVILIPDIFVNSHAFAMSLSSIHELLAIAVLMLLGLHVVAAFYHYKWKEDKVMERMLPNGLVS